MAKRCVFTLDLEVVWEKESRVSVSKFAVCEFPWPERLLVFALVNSRSQTDYRTVFRPPGKYKTSVSETEVDETDWEIVETTHTAI